MNIQDLKSNTTWQEASNTINNNNNKISLAIATLENAKLKNKGYFTTVEKLNEAVPNPTIGSKAYVGTSEPYAIYIVENGAWVDSGYTGGDEIVAKITTDRIENGAVTTEKIATSAFDQTLSLSGKIAPADVVGSKLTELEGLLPGGESIQIVKAFIIEKRGSGHWISPTGTYNKTTGWSISEPVHLDIGDRITFDVTVDGTCSLAAYLGDFTRFSPLSENPSVDYTASSAIDVVACGKTVEIKNYTITKHTEKSQAASKKDVEEIATTTSQVKADTERLNKDVYGGSVTEPNTLTPTATDRYYNMSDVTGIGVVIADKDNAASEGTNCYKVDIKAGDKITIYGWGKNNASGLYTLINKEGVVLDFKKSYNASVNPIILDAVEDGTLYVNLSYLTDGRHEVILERATYIPSYKEQIDALSASTEIIQSKVEEMDKGDMFQAIAYSQGNKLLNENKRKTFSWGVRTKGVIAIKSDDLTADVDLVAKIMAERNLPLHLAAPIENLPYAVSGITDESQKIGETRLDVVKYVVEHGGEIMAHTNWTYNNKDYYGEHGIFDTFVYPQKVWSELGINVRGIWVANEFPTDDLIISAAPYLYYYYEYSNGYGDLPPYSLVSKINDGSVSNPTTYDAFVKYIDMVASQKLFGTITIHGFTRISRQTFEDVLTYVQSKVTEGLLDVKTWGQIFDNAKL